MNTIDATPEHSFGDRATLSAQSYERVNGTPRTNSQRRNKFTNCGYGKQILNDACSACVLHSAYRICAKTSAPEKLVNGIARANARKAEAGFGETFISDSQQCPQRERLAQTARHSDRHAPEVRRRSVEVGKGVTGHRNQRNRRRAFVEYPVGP